ncbi:hypothetical protein [Actinomadura rayongensis]|uniref:Uncharacterized protein n=1 Tax=Actinomadura rayongensis TaxID=1429076 RepID=A0A6I4VZQ2_9ACTN|nr:hypothetical protein [Actinomadura rayongensis]MXQ62428.1 hypothetical protein [Actinomadura rayongensis]
MPAPDAAGRVVLAFGRVVPALARVEARAGARVEARAGLPREDEPRVPPEARAVVLRADDDRLDELLRARLVVGFFAVERAAAVFGLAAVLRDADARGLVVDDPVEIALAAVFIALAASAIALVALVMALVMAVIALTEPLVLLATDFICVAAAFACVAAAVTLVAAAEPARLVVVFFAAGRVVRAETVDLDVLPAALVRLDGARFLALGFVVRFVLLLRLFVLVATDLPPVLISYGWLIPRHAPL